MTAATELDWTVALAAARARALSAGALVPIAVEGEIVVDNGVEFRVEWISSLAMKDMAAIPRVGDKAKDFNPFLPYDENLFVTEVSDTHVAILNRFPSWDGHFLLITRAFVEQESPLDIADADALARALSGVDGYAFYNSGGAAGASQRHRHLQIIPGFVTPIAKLLPADIPLHVMSAAPRLPYRHAYCRLDRAKFERGGADGAFLHGLITEACRTAGTRSDGQDHGTLQSHGEPRLADRDAAGDRNRRRPVPERAELFRTYWIANARSDRNRAPDRPFLHAGTSRWAGPIKRSLTQNIR